MKLFDLHCDTVYECYRNGRSLSRNPLHIDLTRGRRYAPWCQVFAVWIPDSVRGEAAFHLTCEMLHFARAEAAAHASCIRFVTDGRQRRKAVEQHVCAGVLALENAAGIGGKIENIAALAALGVRIVTITWNGENEWGYGCGCDLKKGLKSFGKAGITALENAGIVPDVSHLNEAGFWDAAQQCRGPFIASHSLSAVICPHPRNLSDQQFAEIVRRGGLVGLSFCDTHLGEATLDAIRRHAEHFLSLGGERTVALGGDLDGTLLPDEWGGVAVYEKLADYLAKKGWQEGLIERIFYQNAANFLDTTLQARDIPL